MQPSTKFDALTKLKIKSHENVQTVCHFLNVIAQRIKSTPTSIRRTWRWGCRGKWNPSCLGFLLPHTVVAVTRAAHPPHDLGRCNVQTASCVVTQKEQHLLSTPKHCVINDWTSMKKAILQVRRCILPLYMDIFFLCRVFFFLAALLLFRIWRSLTRPGVAPAYCADPEQVFLATVMSSTNICISSMSDSSMDSRLRPSPDFTYWRGSNPEFVDFMFQLLAMFCL